MARRARSAQREGAVVTAPTASAMDAAGERRTAWTPGPWKASGAANVTASDGRSIATCDVSKRSAKSGVAPEDVANARLISAAPDLFEALATARCPHPANGAPDWLTTEDCLARGECGCDQGAAIRKARGE